MSTADRANTLADPDVAEAPDKYAPKQAPNRVFPSSKLADHEEARLTCPENYSVHQVMQKAQIAFQSTDCHHIPIAPKQCFGPLMFDSAPDARNRGSTILADAALWTKHSGLDKLMSKGASVRARLTFGRTVTA